MKGKKRFLILPHIFIIGVLIFSTNSTNAKKIKVTKNTGINSCSISRQYRTHVIKSKKSNCGLKFQREIKDNGYNCFRQLREAPSTGKNDIKIEDNPSGRYAPGFSGPPWFVNQDDFPGGPSWLRNKKEGGCPWFWQAYNDHYVSGTAPPWFLNPLTTEHVPAWLHKKNGGPWWSYYLSQLIIPKRSYEPNT